MKGNKIIAIYFLALALAGTLGYWVFKFENFSNKRDTDPVSDATLFSSAPVLSPQQALQTFRLAEEDFQVDLVASEPLIHNPVALTFDEKGRIWVVEMQSYMQDIDGASEDAAISRILILEDQNDDGRMDTSKIFMDELVMPRAIAMANGGILYAEPPNLWFVRNMNDRPGKKILIDSAYAVGGNAEHQANGLMRGIDNWYYNAKSNVRYKYKNNQWIREETAFRGQWGITKDSYGRLFYNTNSNQLRGDLVPPNTLSRNLDYNANFGINIEIAANQEVYPARPTPGINRGYKDEILDGNKRLKEFTAACGPLIYRGDNFPESYQGNAFVCEPAANLIKRNILYENAPYIVAKQAYANQEFLASTDERFRPVNLYNGPDGSLYIVDMYQGIIQHEEYLTDYLKDEIVSRKLNKPQGLGRIYRVGYKNEKGSRISSAYGKKVALDRATNADLISFLSHPNGWWRDNAQRLLVERDVKELVPKILRSFELNQNNYKGQIHALWTLEGMGIYTPEVLAHACRAVHPKVLATAVHIGEQNKKDPHKVLDIYQQIINNKDPLVQLQLALSLGEFINADEARVLQMLKAIALYNKEDVLIREAIISSLHGKISGFLTLMKSVSPFDSPILSELKAVRRKNLIKKKLKKKNLTNVEKEQFIKGQALYNKTCSGCHQQNGKGLKPLAPPLDGSEWVIGSKERLIRIVLHGLMEPVKVAGKEYQPPDVQPLMPGLKDNKEFTDKNVSALLTYIRNGWGNQAEAIDPETVNRIRKKYMDRNEPYTSDELVE